MGTGTTIVGASFTGAISDKIGAAAAAADAMARMPAYARQEVLEHCVARFRERSDELARGLCVEAGKPIRDARGEVGRLIDTFKVAAEETGSLAVSKGAWGRESERETTPTR